MKIQNRGQIGRPAYQEIDAENDDREQQNSMLLPYNLQEEDGRYPKDEGWLRPGVHDMLFRLPKEGYVFYGSAEEGYTVKTPNGVMRVFPPGWSRADIRNYLDGKTFARQEGGGPETTEIRLPQTEEIFTAVKSRRSPEDESAQKKEISPLLRRHYQNRLAQLDYIDRQQSMQDGYTTALYGKHDTSQERAQINEKLGLESQNEDRDNEPEPIVEKKDKTLEPPFQPAAADEPSGFDERGALWRIQQGLKKFFSKKHEGQSVNKTPEPKELDAFERLGIKDPKKTEGDTQSMSPEEKQRRDFYKEKTWHKPQGTSVAEWDARNEVLRNQKRVNDKNEVTSELRCNTTMGRELKKMGVDVDKDVNMNGIISGMEASGDWATIPRLENGKLDHKTAVQLAREGYVVTAVQPLPDGEHGHGGVLTGGPNSFSRTWQSEMPEIYASRGGDSARKGSMSWQWKPEAEGSIEYMVYREKRTPVNSPGEKEKK